MRTGSGRILGGVTPQGALLDPRQSVPVAVAGMIGHQGGQLQHGGMEREPVFFMANRKIAAGNKQEANFSSTFSGANCESSSFGNSIASSVSNKE